MTTLKTLIFTLLVPGTVTVYVPYLLLACLDHRTKIDVRGGGTPGLVLVILGLLVYSWCAWDFIVRGRGTPSPNDPPQELVASGLYQFVRNPMYLGVLGVLAGEALLFRSVTLAAYAALIAIGFHLRVLRYEEPTLQRAFGPSFDRYCRAVPRWLPRIRFRTSER